jgi:hypothetical protein
MGDKAGFEERFVTVRGMAAGAGAVLVGFLVLDQRGHGGSGMRY